MELHFFGNGSGFSGSHTNAYFLSGNNMILIDMSMLNVHKALKKIREVKPERVCLILTHPHADHVSGIGMLAQHLYYQDKMELDIAMPEPIADDVQNLLYIEGVDGNAYNMILLYPYGPGMLLMNEEKENEDLINSCLLDIIATEHAPELAGKCFGYRFLVNNTQAIYTGDTCCLEDFIPLLDEHIPEYEKTELYVDCSIKYGGVHLKWDDVSDKLKSIAESGVSVYLMHLDDMEAAGRTEFGDVKIAMTD